MSDEADRVKIWNSYLMQANAAARELAQRHGDYPLLTLDGNHLNREQHYSLMTVLYSVLAIEARANHLIHELHEQGKITRDVRDAATRLSTKHKWFLLPLLAGQTKAKMDKAAHQGVAKLCKFRNELVHVKFDRRILRDIPAKSETLQLYNQFIQAMGDMNVLLSRWDAPRKDVLGELAVHESPSEPEGGNAA